jgi:hypothetical protein
MGTELANFGQQNYDPPSVLAIPPRNFVCGTLSMSTGAQSTLFGFDLWVIPRGGAATGLGSSIASGPAAGLNLLLSVNCNQSGVTFVPQVQFGDGVFITMVPGGVIFPSGFSQYELKVNGAFFKGLVTRVASSTTVITFHASMLGDN